MIFGRLREIPLQLSRREALGGGVHERRGRRRAVPIARLRPRLDARLQAGDQGAALGEALHGTGSRLKRKLDRQQAGDDKRNQRSDRQGLLAVQLHQRFHSSATLRPGSTCASILKRNRLPSGLRVVGAKKRTSVRRPDRSSNATSEGASLANPTMRKVAPSRRNSVK